MKSRWLFASALLILCLAACGPEPGSSTAQAGLPNPASVFCEQHGGRLELRTDPTGAVSGACLFPAGSECDEWAYFRGECKPGDSLGAPGSPSPTAESAETGWKLYHNQAFGYSFEYPADAGIEFVDDAMKSISIIGPEENGERWPQLSISHPSDRSDYRPPQGVDLAQWLTEHSLFGDQRLPDVTIAGETAVHLRHERSPQAYAYDRYFFAHTGQLYMVLINHAGDKEDWELYKHFLESIQFDP
jgi:putative hemolysin